MSGWIKLHRKLLDWEWYSKPVVKSVFIHGLLRANHKDGKWQGKDIKRGSFISSVDKLSSELGHSRQEIRTALKHLKSTNELTTLGCSQHTVFIVVNYENYQEATSQLTNEQQTVNHQSTTNKNVKNDNNDNKVVKDKATECNIDWQDLKDYFNKTMPNKNVSVINDKRKKHIRALLKSTGKDIDTLKAHIDNAAESTSGFWKEWREGNVDQNGKHWQPQGFDFYMRESTFIKSLED